MEDIGRRGAFVGFGNTAPGTRADVFGLAQRGAKGTVAAAGGSGNFSPRTGTGYVFLTQMLLRCRRYRLCYRYRRKKRRYRHVTDAADAPPRVLHDHVHAACSS